MYFDPMEAAEDKKDKEAYDKLLEFLKGKINADEFDKDRALRYIMRMQSQLKMAESKIGRYQKFFFELGDLLPKQSNNIM